MSMTTEDIVDAQILNDIITQRLRGIHSKLVAQKSKVPDTNSFHLIKKAISRHEDAQKALILQESSQLES